MFTFRLVLLAVMFVLTGCPKSPENVSPQSNPREVWRPKSSLSRSAAYTAATTLSKSIPDSKVYGILETHSMEPILWGNFYIVAEKVKVVDIQVGDIILYWNQNKTMIILHTCLGNSAGRLTLKGYNNYISDNQANPNRFVTEEDVVGRLVATIVFDPNK